MMFVELFVPKGSLDATRLRHVAERLGTLHELTEGEEIHTGTAEVFRSMFQVVVHEPAVWVAGERMIRPDDRPRYVVRVHVPGPWRKEVSEAVISYVTKVLTEVDDREPVVQVHVLGVAEGSIGLNGQAKTSTEIVELMSEPYQEDFASGNAVKDPLCGVIVPLNDTTVTLEMDGTRYGFCCTDCRAAFIRKQQRSQAARG